MAGRFQPFEIMGAGQPQDAEAGAEALLGMGPFMQDRGDQCLGGGADRRRLAADLSGVHSAKRRWLDGMWSRRVVWRRSGGLRRCAATRWPSWKSSTVFSVRRAQTFWRSSRWGTE